MPTNYDWCHVKHAEPRNNPKNLIHEGMLAENVKENSPEKNPVDPLRFAKKTFKL